MWRQCSIMLLLIACVGVTAGCLGSRQDECATNPCLVAWEIAAANPQLLGIEGAEDPFGGEGQVVGCDQIHGGLTSRGCRSDDPRSLSAVYHLRNNEYPGSASLIAKLQISERKEDSGYLITINVGEPQFLYGAEYVALTVSDTVDSNFVLLSSGKKVSLPAKFAVQEFGQDGIQLILRPRKGEAGFWRLPHTGREKG